VIDVSSEFNQDSYVTLHHVQNFHRIWCTRSGAPQTAIRPHSPQLKRTTILNQALGVKELKKRKAKEIHGRGEISQLHGRKREGCVADSDNKSTDVQDSNGEEYSTKVTMPVEKKQYAE
jgi:hypothetical protein